MVDRQGKAMRIVVGVMLMAAFVLIAFGVVGRYAGAWGVPYFSFTTDRGSTCTNNLTGYVCDSLTLGDVLAFSSPDALAMPAGTKVVSSSYRATHDYTLSAELLVPRAGAAAAMQTLAGEFGACSRTQPSPLNPRGLTAVCTMANSDSVTQSGEPPSRIWVVGTALRSDGARVINLNVRSR